jgi:hypothetical protein
MKRASNWVLFLFSFLFFTTILTADTLFLRDGRRIEGRLISVRNDVVEFNDAPGFGGRTLRFDRNQLTGIQFEQNDGGFSSRPGQGQRSGRPSTSGLRERQVMVQAAVPWVDTGIDVRAGQDVYFQAQGEVTWGPGRRHGPGGETGSPVNVNRPLPNRPAAALIGRIGETDGFFIGLDNGPVRMRGSGRLFLGINDDYLQDNSGSFRVIVFY